jgi:hypothetical protein
MPPVDPVQGFLKNGSPIQKQKGLKKIFGPQTPLNTLKEIFMITTIKNVLKKVTVVEWVVLGVITAALVIGLTQCGGKDHKGHRGGNKHDSEPSVKVSETAK